MSLILYRRGTMVVQQSPKLPYVRSNRAVYANLRRRGRTRSLPSPRQQGTPLNRGYLALSAGIESSPQFNFAIEGF